jgi:uncharacterized protein (DUF362 family)
MDRRRFLIVGGQALGATLAADTLLTGVLSAAEADVETTRLPDLVLAKGDAATATNNALTAFGGMERFVKPGNVVVLKPNASFVTPAAWGATTDPTVVATVAQSCLAAGARRVLVVDHTLVPANRCFARNGLKAALAEIQNTKLVSLDKQKSYIDIDIPGAKALHKTSVASVVQKADVFINLPTAKSHSATGVSFGLKNLMGVIWDRQTFHTDMDVHVGVADLATVVKPHLTILDAMQILKTGGPEGPGDTDPFGGIIIGVDPVAVDAYATGLSTWNHQTLTPSQVPFLRYAEELGVGTTDLSSLNILELT